MEKMNTLVIMFLTGAVAVFSYLYYQETRNEITLNLKLPHVDIKKK